ncbi:MAG TPA: beta-propeller fold lactonase family protein [Acidobacteriaceae bacterium]|jgi:6-phosphogluconolactonase (cycloisomerase 2 family)|nr:beta-propeller fold lactonase family protein [Acidobacteriaceae bacterium]
MKFRQFGRRLLAAASLAGVSLVLLSCGASNTVDFLYVTSNKVNPGQINVYEVDSESGELFQIHDSPYPSGGRNPVYEVAAPNGQSLYVANHDDNTIVRFAIGTDGKLYPLQTITTPGTEPVALAINASGTALFVLDYYAPVAPGQPSYTDLNPGPGAVIVYPIVDPATGSLGSPLATGAQDYWPVQCFPSNIAVTPNNGFVYVTNPNSVVVTTAPPVTGTVPTLPAACQGSGTVSGSVSGFAISGSSGSISGLTAVTGSPFSTGSGSAPTGIVAGPAGGAVYVTDSALNQLYTYTIGPGGALSLAGTTNTGAMPMGGTIVNSASGGKFLYITNYAGGSLSIFSLASGLPSLVATGSPGSSGPLCILADPDTGRYLYTANYTGGTVGGSELDPSNGTLITNKDSPYATSGQPTCVAAITHAGGNAHNL